MAALDFWTEKLNPITMYSTEQRVYDPVKNKEYKVSSEKYHLKESEFSEEKYIEANQAKYVLKIGYKRINYIIRDNLDVSQSSFYFKSKTYYKKEHVEFVLKVLKLKKENFLTDDYISSSDLKLILGINTMQLFTLSNRNKWKKFKFAGHGNVKFYLKSQVLK